LAKSARKKGSVTRQNGDVEMTYAESSGAQVEQGASVGSKMGAITSFGPCLDVNFHPVPSPAHLLWDRLKTQFDGIETNQQPIKVFPPVYGLLIASGASLLLWIGGYFIVKSLLG
jgi:hypothetical protein